MKKTILLSFTCLFLICRHSFAQDSSSLKLPMQISFVYPLGTGGITSHEQEYRFSLNILAGVTGRINGAELAGLGNINKGAVKGFQAAGLYNISGGSAEGVRCAGLFNMNRQAGRGVAAAGLFNLGAGSEGVLAAGLFNISAGSSKGVLAAGLFNVIKGASSGSNLAGIFNYRHKDHKGFSAAGIFNYTNGRNAGVQLAGILNQARILKGVQVGLINIADTVESGVSIGLINIVRKGAYREVELSVADYQQVGISYRSGSRLFYNIYSIGYNTMNDRLWSLGVGFGHTAKLGAHVFLQPELMAYSYAPENFRDLRRTAAYHLRLGVGYKFTEHVAVALTPGLYVSDRENRGKNAEGYRISPLQPVYEGEGCLGKWGIGAGLLVGLKFSY